MPFKETPLLNVRKYLADLMGVQKITDDDIRKELDELKIDNKVDELTKEGHVAADPETQALVRKGIAGQLTAQELEQLLRTAKPAPAATQTITPAAGPAGNEDPTEAAIQARMAETKEPYHVAANEVSKGAAIINPIGSEGA